MRLVKLVRDGIAEMFRDADIVYQIIPYEDLTRRLVWKILEEAWEYIEKPSLDEAADIYEALVGLVHHDLGMNIQDVADRASEKKAERGGFDSGVGMYLRKK